MSAAENEMAYRNYKKFHSFVIMAIVNADRTFSYIFTGYPGRSHDSYIFQRSSKYTKLENNELFNSNKYHLIGDSAFALKRYMLVPYKKTPAGLKPSQKAFDKRLSGSCMIVENVFADIKNRTCRCRDIDATIENAVNIVVTCCVIHNICIRNGDLNHNLHDNAPLNCNVNPPLMANNDHDVAANAKRDILRKRFQRRVIAAYRR
jgi:hypothetical protein